MDGMEMVYGGLIVIVALIFVLIAFVAYQAYRAFTDKPVRNEGFDQVLEVSRKENGMIFVPYNGREYPLPNPDGKLSDALEVGDQVLVMVHESYNRRGEKKNRYLTILDPEFS